MRFEFRFSLVCILMIVGAFFSHAAAKPVSPPEPATGSEILWSLQKLDTLGRVLYVAAHPDDENTRLISYLSLGRKYDTAYLSLTRGDGGQNLIGPELRDQLGVIRTQELLEARRIDGGLQFFSRAKDFGYSKTATETFAIWDREQVLADTVWVVRQFQPDVIVTRFSPIPSSTHGHHTASAILALEAFEAAADASRFPEQLPYVEPWQAKRVVWNTSRWQGADSGAGDGATIDVGGYDPLLGKSYNEIASASRSMHLSQGFGTRIDRGSRLESFQLLAGDAFQTDLFNGVDTSWRRVEDSDTIRSAVAKLIANFAVGNPAASVPALLELRERLESLGDSPWIERKRAELDGIVLACMGMDMRLVNTGPYVRNGDTLNLELELINRSSIDARLLSVSLPFAGFSQKASVDLPLNAPVSYAVKAKVPDAAPLPQPYWLASAGTLGMFDVKDLLLIGKDENDSAFLALAEIEVRGSVLSVELPLVYREVDPAKGESIRPVLNLPAAAVSFATPVSLFPNFESKELVVSVAALLSPAEGRLSLELPNGWSAEPSFYDVDTIPRNEERSYVFRVTPRAQSEEVVLKARLSTPQQVFDQSLARIHYEHIREQTVFSLASTRAVSLEVARAGDRVGYLPGAGDSVADSIREIGFDVHQLPVEGFRAADLEGLDTVVVGIRAFNTLDGIGAIMEELFSFAAEGGTVIVQYNTSHRLKSATLAPYSISLSRNRVTDETAEVRVIAPNHPVMTVPNQIGPADFSGWTQERGLYFPSSWDSAFQPIFSMSDPGERASEGSLLVAKYGKGYFVYTGISWFRQLPAGVPGAYRIFANLLSLGHASENR